MQARRLVQGFPSPRANGQVELDTAPSTSLDSRPALTGLSRILFPDGAKA